jgi:hypothetical protein
MRRLPPGTRAYQIGDPLVYAGMNHDQTILNFVTYLFLVLSIVLTFLRCYTRFYLLKSSGADDIISICSLVRIEISLRVLRRIY